MAAIVGVDALVVISSDGGTTWSVLSERNEFSISIKVDVAEHKVFVGSLSDAWADKKRTWMSWSGSLQGYFSDTDNTIYDKVVAGNQVAVRFYPTRYGAALGGDNLPTGVTKYWQGNCVLTSVEHGVGTDDFATLSVDFEGVGKLNKVG